jgi:hypothetical protein
MAGVVLSKAPIWFSASKKDSLTAQLIPTIADLSTLPVLPVLTFLWVFQYIKVFSPDYLF